MDEVTLVICRWVQVIYTSLNSLTFRKVHLKQYNFRVPVYKGVPLPWMKWNSSFNDDCWPAIVVSKVPTFEKYIPLPWIKWNSSFADERRSSILVWTASLSEECILNKATLVCPIIRGFPSHGWSETHPLTMTARFQILKTWSHGWSEPRPLTMTAGHVD